MLIVLPKPQCISVPGQRMRKRTTVIIVKISTITSRKRIEWVGDDKRRRVKVSEPNVKIIIFAHK